MAHHALVAMIILLVLGDATRMSTDLSDCCHVESNLKDDIRQWLELAAIIDTCCEDYGPLFGWHASRQCPTHIAYVAQAVQRGVHDASGGKSGAKVIVTPEYVIKVISEDEKAHLDSLLRYLKEGKRTKDEMSVLVPTCRAVKVTAQSSPQYLQIMPNVALGGSPGPHMMFDLKGNWDYSSRNSPVGARVMKDMNFHNIFPNSVDIVKSSLRGSMEGRSAWAVGAIKLIQSLQRDTTALADLELMDYSLLVDMVDLCPEKIVVTSEKDFVALESGKPLILSPFTKTKIALDAVHGWRPIYANPDREYLYYWAKWGEWCIGRNYIENSRGVASHTKAMCPDDATSWMIHKGGSYQERERPQGWASNYGVTLRGDDRESVEDRIIRSNPNKGLLWASSDDMKFVMSVGIIDVFMHGQARGFWNTFGSGITFSACTPDDIDPIPAKEYRVRFMRMVGYKDPTYRSGEYCGSCLGSRRRESYTYFASEYQRERSAQGECEWGS